MGNLTKHMGLIPRQPTVEELGWGNSPFPIPAFSLQPFAFSLFLMWLSLRQTPEFRQRLVKETKRLTLTYLQSYGSVK